MMSSMSSCFMLFRFKKKNTIYGVGVHDLYYMPRYYVGMVTERVWDWVASVPILSLLFKIIFILSH